MKSKFPAYYRIHKEDILAKFDDCVFMFDTSALLDVFRLKKELSEKVFEVIEHYQAQVKIPYHVAEEYNRSIHDVLKKQLKYITDSRNSFNAFVKTFAAKRSMPYISADTKRLLDLLHEQIEKEYSDQEHYVKDQLLHGEYQNRMADLLEGKVLNPFTIEEIEKIAKEGETRYSNNVPPGFKDAAKGDNRYGDLINWKEILRFAKSSHKHIIFIANDEKEDWVCKENGMTIGPLYDLLKEFYNEMGDNDHFFHIYTLDRFLSLVNEKDADIVSTDVVQEVKDYIESPSNDTPSFAELISAIQGNIVMSAPLGSHAVTIESFNKSAERIRELSKMTERLRAETRPWGTMKFANDRLSSADILEEEKQFHEEGKISSHGEKAIDTLESQRVSDYTSEKAKCNKDSNVEKNGL